MTSTLNLHTSIEFNPYFEPWVMVAVIVLLAALWGGFFATIYWRAIWRIPFLGVLLLALMNPSVRVEEREPLNSTVLVVVDESQSQKIKNREAQTQDTLSWLEESTSDFKEIDLRIIRTNNINTSHETQLFKAYKEALLDIPPGRLAASFWITDGQIHDLPDSFDESHPNAPVHAIITGEKQETDRILTLVQAPSYGIVGQDIEVIVRVEDLPHGSAEQTQPVSLFVDTGAQTYQETLLIGQDFILNLPVKHAGQNVISLSAEPAENELSLSNNKQAIVVHGIRDKLKVLLVSGQPHAGGRMWRNILTSDPSVELIHFTILRDPLKRDATPENELALIPFPIRQLFEVKLYDFDLVIFDRFARTNILPPKYFANISQYVQEGGAFLEASGPGFSSELSVYKTALKDILPASPGEKIYEEAFTPSLSEQGLLHPVTAPLTRYQAQSQKMPTWAPWYRQLEIQKLRGQTLMTGYNGEPLLILDRAKQGRVAQFSSDQLWLWARGYKGGGPHAELLRRTLHWLMKEPDLEEDALVLAEKSGHIMIKKRLFKDSSENITLTKPDGTQEDLVLKGVVGSFAEQKIKADQLGVYSVSIGDTKRHLVIGEINAPEMHKILSSVEAPSQLLEQQKGTVIRWEDMSQKRLRKISSKNRMYGQNWLGIRAEQAYQVLSQKLTPLFSVWTYLMLLLATVSLAWWREGRDS